MGASRQPSIGRFRESTLRLSGAKRMTVSCCSMPMQTTQNPCHSQTHSPGYLPSCSRPPIHTTEAKKQAFRSLTGSIHYLLPEEIRYIKADNNVCQIFTTSGFFSCRTTLKKLTSPPFLRIHKSYLVNSSHLREICRYQATLLDGTKLPIGKEWYMDLKQWMMKNCND